MEPEGMLNGATMKVRSASAARNSRSRKRRVDHQLSFFAVGAVEGSMAASLSMGALSLGAGAGSSGAVANRQRASAFQRSGLSVNQDGFHGGTHGERGTGRTV